MSKARSPRDVCSTTMGTSGLIRISLSLARALRIPSISLVDMSGGPEQLAIGGTGQIRLVPARACALDQGQLPGVQIFSRAAARSGSIGLAFSATRSTALRM